MINNQHQNDVVTLDVISRVSEHVRRTVRFHIRRLTCTKNSSFKKQLLVHEQQKNSACQVQSQVPDMHPSMLLFFSKNSSQSSTNPAHIRCTVRLNVRGLTYLLQTYFWINILTNLHLNPKVKHHSRDLITIIALQRLLLSRINIE